MGRSPSSVHLSGPPPVRRLGVSLDRDEGAGGQAQPVHAVAFDGEEVVRLGGEHLGDGPRDVSRDAGQRGAVTGGDRRTRRSARLGGFTIRPSEYAIGASGPEGWLEQRFPLGHGARRYQSSLNIGIPKAIALVHGAHPPSAGFSLLGIILRSGWREALDRRRVALTDLRLGDEVEAGPAEVVLSLPPCLVDELRPHAVIAAASHPPGLVVVDDVHVHDRRIVLEAEPRPDVDSDDLDVAELALEGRLGDLAYLLLVHLGPPMAAA